MIKKILSYFFPSTRKLDSAYNGKIAIVYSKGKKLLNTPHTNYSYGSLEKVMRFALNRCDLRLCKNILVLGMGGGCVLKVLREEIGYLGKITAIDFDPVIVQLAKEEFGISADPKTTILCEDADLFVKRSKEKFDLILIDLFIDDKVPQVFSGSEFWDGLVRILNEKSSVVFNTLDEPATDLKPAGKALIDAGMEVQIFQHVERTNRVLIASNVN